MPHGLSASQRVKAHPSKFNSPPPPCSEDRLYFAGAVFGRECDAWKICGWKVHSLKLGS